MGTSKVRPSDLQRMHGIYQGFIDNLVDAAREVEGGVEAVHWLGTGEGKGTFAKVIGLAKSEHRIAEMCRPVSGTLLVPDVPAPELVQRALTAHDLNRRAGSVLAEWDFLKDSNGRAIHARGRRFEVRFYAPWPECVNTKMVREYFRPQGFNGNVAAFVALVAEKKLCGSFATIPHDDAERYRPEPDRPLYAVCFERGRGYCGFSVYDATLGWPEETIFVAFREKPSDA